jgi:8-oxo-dGTP pyrophosphatase MutT (NUDIX family)
VLVPTNSEPGDNASTRQHETLRLSARGPPLFRHRLTRQCPIKKYEERRALCAHAGGRRGRRGCLVLQEPVLGAANGEHRDRPGVRGLLITVPEMKNESKLLLPARLREGNWTAGKMDKSETRDPVQYAALPIHEAGTPRVMLLTSRETGRWVIPKGWPMPGRKPCQVAKREAFEEAGLISKMVSKQPVGSYHYTKVEACQELAPRNSPDVEPPSAPSFRRPWPLGHRVLTQSSPRYRLGRARRRFPSQSLGQCYLGSRQASFSGSEVAVVYLRYGWRGRHGRGRMPLLPTDSSIRGSTYHE